MKDPGWTQVGPGPTWSDLGPAEGAEPSYSFCKQNSDIRQCLQICNRHYVKHSLARQGAGRIEPAERYTASPRSGVSEILLAISRLLCIAYGIRICFI